MGAGWLGGSGCAPGQRRRQRAALAASFAPVLAAGLVGAAAAPAVAVPAVPQFAAARAIGGDDAAASLDALRRIEQSGRANPRQGAAAAARLLAAPGLDAPTQVEGLAIQGWLLATAPDAEAAEAVARRLDALAAGVDGAAAAAALIRAKTAQQAGDTPRALLLIDDARVQLPAAASLPARLRLELAQAHIRNGASRLDEAIRHGHSALRHADALGLPVWQAEARNELAWSYFQAGQREPAWALNQEALAIARRDGDALTLAHLYTVQGILQDARGDASVVRESMEAALEHARRAGAKSEEALYLANLADYYLKRADYATALRHASLALPLTRELRNVNGETVALANIGLAQIGLRDLEAGKRHLREALAIDERRGSLTGMSDTYAEMGQALERAGDAAAAIEALHQHRLLADQVLQRAQQQAILEQREQFDAERRARELELLQRDGELKAQQLRTRGLQQALYGLAVVGGALAAAAGLLLVRRTRRANAHLALSNARLKEQAELDPLTGLANRRQAQAVLRGLDAGGGFAGTLLLVDLDHFKRINDRHGHAAGDAVLAEVARRLRAMLREDDLVARWGGEEFLVIARATAAEAVQALAQRMLEAIGGDPVPVGAEPVPVTASIGFASFPLPPAGRVLGAERALDLIDTAMYLAKAHGRNRGYGVKAMHARDEPHAQAIGRALEDAWHAGEVELVRLDGPAAVPAATPDEVAA